MALRGLCTHARVLELTCVYVCMYTRVHVRVYVY